MSAGLHGDREQHTTVGPPRLWSLLLRWSLPGDLRRRVILGDLHEEHRRRASTGPREAARWYRRQAIGVAARASVACAGAVLGALAHGPAALIADLRYGCRNLLRAPAFTTVAVASLALGIGASTAVFSAVNALFLRPPALVWEPESLVSIYDRDNDAGGLGVLSWPDFLDVREQVVAFDDVMAFAISGPVRWSQDDQVVELLASAVSWNYFDVLGVPLTLGRSLTREEAESEARVVLLAERVWRTRLDADPTVVGRSIRLNGEPHVVIGVVPDGLTVPGFPVVADAYRPVIGDHIGHRGTSMLSLMGRLRSEATIEQVREQLTVVAARLHRDHPRLWSDRRGEARSLVAVPESLARLGPDQRAGVATFLGALMVGVGLVLAVACSNLANLLLARGSKRQPELAVRLALGASRRRVAGMMLAEALLVSFLGGLAGLLLTHWLTSLIARGGLVTALPFRIDLGVDGRVLAFTIMVSVATSVLFGLLPALRVVSPDLVRSLKGQHDGAMLGRSMSRNALVVGQLAVSLVLVVTATLFLRSVTHAAGAELGFDPDGVAVVDLDLSQGDYGYDDGLAFLDELSERLRSRPGVTHVSFARFVPMGSDAQREFVEIEGYEAAAGEEIGVGVNSVASEYFELIGMPMARGREFMSSDDDASQMVAVVNQEFVRRFWPDGKALGRRFTTGDNNRTVVGVVQDAFYRRLDEPPLPHFWLPLRQSWAGRTQLHVRVDGALEPVLAALRPMIAEIDSQLPVAAPATMRQLTLLSLLPDRIASAILAVGELMALVLAIIGVYGVVGYAAAQRTREIGVRVALGADRSGVLWMVLSQGLRLAATGLAIGTLLVFAVSLPLRSLLHGVSPLDPLSLVTGAGLLGLAALVTALAPALRASRVDPMTALRLD